MSHQQSRPSHPLAWQQQQLPLLPGLDQGSPELLQELSSLRCMAATLLRRMLCLEVRMHAQQQGSSAAAPLAAAVPAAQQPQQQGPATAAAAARPCPEPCLPLTSRVEMPGMARLRSLPEDWSDLEGPEVGWLAGMDGAAASGPHMYTPRAVRLPVAF